MMQPTIRFCGAKPADFANHDFEDVLLNALDRFRHRLKQVYLYLEDVNGPRGGIDKQCRCVLHLRRIPPVVIQDQDECMSSLVHRVASRAVYALSQKADRQKKRIKQNRKSRRQQAFATALQSSSDVSLPSLEL
jgi:putative sigma-54 modulation protein